MKRTRMCANQLSDEGPLVCVIDDDPSMRRSLGRLLKGSEWRVQSFESAETFLEELDKLANGLLIVDVKLPGMSGLELLEKMQEMYRSWPSIVMSGSDSAAWLTGGSRALPHVLPSASGSNVFGPRNPR